MDWFRNEVAGRWDLIKSHPVPFAVIFAGGTVIGFSVAVYFFQSRLDTLGEAYLVLRDQKADGLPITAPPTSEVVSNVPWGMVAAGLFVIILLIGAIWLLGPRRSHKSADGKEADANTPAPISLAPKPDTSEQHVLEALQPITKVEGAEAHPFLQAVGSERSARPHLRLVRAARDLHMPAGRKQVRSAIAIESTVANPLQGCRVIVEAVTCGDARTSLYNYVYHRGKSDFDLPPRGNATLILSYRNFEVAPEERTKLNAISQNALTGRTFTFDDDATYEVHLVLDGGQGVVTRAVVVLEIGQYEELVVSLKGQSSWRREP